MHRNIVQPPSQTDTCTIKWINKYLLFRPHISLEYNYISDLTLDFYSLLLKVLIIK